MQVKFTKRLSAYMIDFIILSFVTTLITLVLPKSDRIKELDKSLIELQDKYVKEEITNEDYIKQYGEIVPAYDKENLMINICGLVFILGYFVVIPIINNGQTIGKKLLKIKVIKNEGKLTILDMICRNFIVTSLLQLIVSTLFIYAIPNNIYYKLITIIGFLQILLVTITIFMILYRKDKKGVQDLITNTSVVEVEK